MNEPNSPAPFQAPDPVELAPLFPGYEIQNLIATGGMGAVYQALQKSLDRTVAIKILPLELSADARFREGFEAEAKAMARLNHPNLIGVYDFGEVSGMLFIVMEYVWGKSLYHSARGIRIDPAEVVKLVTGICNGLSHAHKNGVLHRDIKPANILLTPEKVPKIGDFGLARPLERASDAGELVYGTPGYTAPEVTCAPDTVDQRADLFSVGVILHELLAGKLPDGDPRPTSEIAGCNVRFDAIIRRATDPSPERRYFNVAELAMDLQAMSGDYSEGPQGLMTTPQLDDAVLAFPPQQALGPSSRNTAAPAGPTEAPARPPIRRIGPPAAAKPKLKNLSWVGLVLALMLPFVFWKLASKIEPRAIVIGKPDGVSDPSSGNPRAQAEKPEEPVTPQAKPEAAPVVSGPPPEPQVPAANTRTEPIEVTNHSELRTKIGQVVRVRGTIETFGVTPPPNSDCLFYLSPRGPSSLKIAVALTDPATQARHDRLLAFIGKRIQTEGVVEAYGPGLAIRVPNLEGLARPADGALPAGQQPSQAHIPEDAVQSGEAGLDGKQEILIEGEMLEVLAANGGRPQNQSMGGFRGQWSNGSQLWWRDGGIGSSLKLGIPVKTKGKYQLSAVFTKSWDYGVVSIKLNSKEVLPSFDGFNADKVITSDEVDLGEHELDESGQELVVDIVGANSRVPEKFKVYGFGIDYIKLRKIENSGNSSALAGEANGVESADDADDAKNQVLDPVVGIWAWSVAEGRQFSLQSDGVASQGGRKGYWVCKNPLEKPRQYVITWDDGKFVDSFELSADGTRMEGSNQLGAKLLALRHASVVVAPAPQVTAQSSAAPVADVVGTWRYNESTLLEMRPDGTVFSNSKANGRWRIRDKKGEYEVTLGNRKEYIMVIDKYKRNLTMSSRSSGSPVTMPRVDDGPTKNPNVPDQATAWRMEARDLEAEIKSAEGSLRLAKERAAELWEKYQRAKALGRVNSWKSEAERAERSVSAYERRITEAHKRMGELKSKLETP